MPDPTGASERCAVDVTQPTAAAFERDGLKSVGLLRLSNSLRDRTRLTSSARDYVRRHAGRSAGLSPSPAPTPTLREGVNVFLARTEVVEEVQLLPVHDHLVPAQFDELVLGQEAEESRFMPDK
jgi:hypothetical protein